jgi:hypothetical protein
MSDLVARVRELESRLDNIEGIETPQNLRYATFWFGYSETTETMIIYYPGAAALEGAFNVGWNQSVPNDGDEFIWYAPFEQGAYKVAIIGFSASNIGKSDLIIDGTTIANDDWYSVATAQAIVTHNWTPTQTMMHEFKLKVNGKNAASSNYYLLLTCLIVYKI